MADNHEAPVAQHTWYNHRLFDNAYAKLHNERVLSIIPGTGRFCSRGFVGNARVGRCQGDGILILAVACSVDRYDTIPFLYELPG